MKTLHHPDGMVMAEEDVLAWLDAQAAAWPSTELPAASFENPSTPFQGRGLEIGADDRTSLGGKSFSRVNYRRRRLGLSFVSTSGDTVSALEELHDATDGFRVPFIVADLPSMPLLIVQGASRQFPLAQTGVDAWSGSFELHEVVR